MKNVIRFIKKNKDGFIVMLGISIGMLIGGESVLGALFGGIVIGGIVIIAESMFVK